MQDNSLPSVSYKIQFPDMVTKDVIMVPAFGSVTIRFRALSGNSSLPILIPSPWEQELTNVAYGTNTIQLNDTIKEMFDTAQPGDRFDVKVIATYEDKNSNESYEIYYPNTQYVYVPKPIIVSEPSTLALVANYPFDSDGNDASTNNNHLTNYNSVTFDTVNFKQGSGAALFNGSNYFEIANDGRFSPDNFTVACWIKPVNSAGNYQSIATCRSGFSPNVLGWMIYIAPDNSLQFWTGNYPSWSGPGIHLYSDFGNLNAWVHIAFTFTKSTSSLIMYINGTLTTTVSRSYANNTTTTLRIGAGANESSAQFFLKNGTLLDDFRFYDATLSASQISSIYAE